MQVAFDRHRAATAVLRVLREEPNHTILAVDVCPAQGYQLATTPGRQVCEAHEVPQILRPRRHDLVELRALDETLARVASGRRRTTMTLMRMPRCVTVMTRSAASPVTRASRRHTSIINTGEGSNYVALLTKIQGDQTTRELWPFSLRKRGGRQIRDVGRGTAAPPLAPVPGHELGPTWARAVDLGVRDGGCARAGPRTSEVSPRARVRAVN